MLQFSQHQHIESQMAKSTIGYKKPKEGEFIMRDGWYWPDKPCAQEHNSPRNKFKQCVQCVREYRAKKGHFTKNAKEWRADNRKRLNKLRANHRKKNPEASIVNSCRAVAKNKGLPFNITRDDIMIPVFCPILGIKLITGIGDRSDASPSIDRIIPEKGYTKGNIIIISWRANRLKQDASIDELKSIADFYSNLATKN